MSINPTEQLVVEVFARDLRRAKAFYLALGFDLISEEAGFAKLAWEGCQFFLAEHRNLPPAIMFPQANVRIMVADVDAVWQTACGLNARVINPIADRDYGLRDFMITDPDGFGLRFAARLPESAQPNS